MAVTVENAVDLLQERLLEVSDEIMRELSLLEHHIEAVPAEGRAALVMAVMQITATQRSLRTQTDHLPSGSWQRLDALRASLATLEGTLDHLSNIANEHLSPRRPRPAPQALLPRGRNRRAERRVKPQGVLAKSLEGGRNVLNGAWLRLLGLLVMMLAGAAFSYGMFPQASQRPPVAGSTETLAAAGDEITVSPTLPLSRAIERPKRLPVSPPRPPQVTDEPAAARSEDVRPAATGQAGGTASGVDWPIPGMVVAMQPPPVPSAPMERRAGEDATRVPQIATNPEPELAAAIPGGSGFVPVVFTHRDGRVASRAFVELQQRYPNLLGQHRGEPQPVDLGSKGIWHRLVVLPAVSRSEATKLCDRLVSAGYDRCWVKAY